jgi:hypothetical protein
MKINDYNKKMWGLHGKCFDCVIKHESELKRLGKYDEYVSNIMNKNKNSELDDIETFLEEWVDQGDTFVSETGEVEKWGGGDKKSVYKRVKERIAELRELDIYKSQNL